MNNTSECFFWDWKSMGKTLLVVAILAIGILFFFVYPDWERKSASKTYTGNAHALLIEVTPNEILSMTETGNRKVIYSYKVRYRYMVQKTEYVSTDIIPNSLENKKLLSFILTSNNKKYKIKYDSKNPKKSMLIE
jgi:hypothetical protein